MTRHVNQPTYTSDIIGEITRKDEREIVLAREELFRFFEPGSPVIEEFYSQYPDFIEFDTKIRKMPPRSRIGGIDNPMHKTNFALVDKISPEWFVDGIPAEERIEIDPQKAQHKVQAYARFFGADLVGTGPLRQEWVYSHCGRPHGNKEGYQTMGESIDLSHHTNAIALGFRMNYDLLQGAPEFPAMLAAGIEYARIAWAAVLLAEYIRRLGYSARAHHLSNYKVLAVPIAVDCGLGELSRAGILLTKEFGLAVRLAVVSTNMSIAYDKPVDIAAQSFCQSCQICADNCPVGAITHTDKSIYNGIRKWKIDEEKCFSYWYAKGSDCGICMASCPWTEPSNWFHKAMAELASVRGPHQRYMAMADTLIHGKHKSAPPPDYLEPYPKVNLKPIIK